MILDNLKVNLIQDFIGLYKTERTNDFKNKIDNILSTMPEFSKEIYINSGVPDYYLSKHVINPSLELISSSEEKYAPEYFKDIKTKIPNHTAVPVVSGAGAFAYYVNGKLKTIITENDWNTGKNVTKYLLNKVPQVVDKNIWAILFTFAKPISNQNGNDIWSLFKILHESVESDFNDVYAFPKLILTKEPRANFVEKMKLAELKFEESINTDKGILYAHNKEFDLDGFAIYTDTTILESSDNQNYPIFYCNYAYKNYKIAEISDITYKTTNIYSEVDSIKITPIDFNGKIISEVYGNILNGISVGTKVRITEDGKIVLVINPSKDNQKRPYCPNCNKPKDFNSEGKLICKNANCSTYNLDKFIGKTPTYLELFNEISKYLSKSTKPENIENLIVTKEDGEVDKILNIFSKKRRIFDKEMLENFRVSLTKICQK